MTIVLWLKRLLQESQDLVRQRDNSLHGGCHMAWAHVALQNSRTFVSDNVTKQQVLRASHPHGHSTGSVTGPEDIMKQEHHFRTLFSLFKSG